MEVRAGRPGSSAAAVFWVRLSASRETTADPRRRSSRRVYGPARSDPSLADCKHRRRAPAPEDGLTAAPFAVTRCSPRLKAGASTQVNAAGQSASTAGGAGGQTGQADEGVARARRKRREKEEEESSRRQKRKGPGRPQNHGGESEGAGEGPREPSPTAGAGAGLVVEMPSGWKRRVKAAFRHMKRPIEEAYGYLARNHPELLEHGEGTLSEEQ
eukprot:tig00001415_g8667.t1